MAEFHDRFAMTDPHGILFTAFEPSGDALAAGVIKQLKRVRPDLKIWGLGGPKMRDQGIELIETTTDHAVMFLGVISQARVHLLRLKRLRAWLDDHRISGLVPVDSPAANWSICRAVREKVPDAKIVHLAAPQLWAWAGWRIRKLRRLTDHVLCLLPFEPDWFSQRGVRGSFVGHPIFDAHPDGSDTIQPETGPDESHPQPDEPSGSDLHRDTPRDHTLPVIALLPGSRLSEIRANWITMLDAVIRLRDRHPRLRASIAAVNQQAGDLIREMTHERLRVEDWDPWLTLHVHQADRVIADADLVLVVSGTATLQVAGAGKPMVVLYNMSRWVWEFAGRWVMNTRTFALPNLITESLGLGRAVPELVPHHGQVDPVVDQLDRLIENEELMQQQRDLFSQVTRQFQGRSFGKLAAERLLEVINNKGSSG